MLATVRISAQDYERFVFKFYNVRSYPNQRLGQAFCNAFNLNDSNLFYEMDNREALDLIDSFITSEDSTHEFQVQ